MASNTLLLDIFLLTLFCKRANSFCSFQNSFCHFKRLTLLTGVTGVYRFYAGSVILAVVVVHGKARAKMIEQQANTPSTKLSEAQRKQSKDEFRKRSMEFNVSAGIDYLDSFNTCI